jgi:hypothetical protein
MARHFFNALFNGRAANQNFPFGLLRGVHRSPELRNEGDYSIPAKLR